VLQTAGAGAVRDSESQVAHKAMHEAVTTPPLRHKFSDTLITLHVVGGFVLEGKTSAGAPSKPYVV
jgi:hypothetical protein